MLRNVFMYWKKTSLNLCRLFNIIVVVLFFWGIIHSLNDHVCFALYETDNKSNVTNITKTLAKYLVCLCFGKRC